jgi:hypothetical protein
MSITILTDENRYVIEGVREITHFSSDLEVNFATPKAVFGALNEVRLHKIPVSVSVDEPKKYQVRITVNAKTRDVFTFIGQVFNEQDTTPRK